MKGLRLGTVRRPPRGVKKEDFGAPQLFRRLGARTRAERAAVSWALSEPWTDQRWAIFAETYRAEMRAAGRAQRLIALLAALSDETNFSVGCYCENESRCHRSLLREMLADAGGGADSVTFYADPLRALEPAVS